MFMFSYPAAIIYITLSTLDPSFNDQIFERYCNVPIRSKISHAGKELNLSGVGLRTARKFGITAKVYLAAFYSEQTYDSVYDVMSSDSSKILDLHFLRNVKKKDLKNSWEWEDGLELQGFNYVEDFVEEIITTNVSKGQVKTIHISDNQVAFFLDGQLLYQSYDREFINAVKGVYFLYPPNEKMSKGLLGYTDIDC